MKTTLTYTLLASAITLAISFTANAQHHDHAAMQHSQHSDMDHSQHTIPTDAHIDHTQMDHSQHTGMNHTDHTHQPMNHTPTTTAVTQPITPIPTLTDADRTAAFPELHPHSMEHGPNTFSKVQLDRLEIWDAQRSTGQAWEAKAWYGNDINRLWLRSQGERNASHTESADLELLYGRSIAPWWDVVAGIKHQFRPIQSRTSAALGVQGLAPYNFEIAATAYIGEAGYVAATLEVEYELLITNRLILQPSAEIEILFRDDTRRGNDNGLSKAEAGLRLRYEITRQFAPYIGLVHERHFGNLPLQEHNWQGRVTNDTRWVAGVRVWF